MADDEVLQAHYKRFEAFQLLAFKKIPKVNFFFPFYVLLRLSVLFSVLFLYPVCYVKDLHFVFDF